MKRILMYVLALATMLSVSSCFKDEPLNAECDIEEMTLEVASPESVFFQLTDAHQFVLSTDSLIIIPVKEKANITAVTPIFKITAGATITPASGVAQDFSKGPVYYVVTSQDGQWKRRYRVELIPEKIEEKADTIRYDLTNYELDSKGKYNVWYNLLEDGSKSYDWASGNAGFQLSMGSALPLDYPTVPAKGEGIDGRDCIKVITRSTGSFGVMVNKRIAAGNFFLGEFDVSIALKDAMRATRFGRPFVSKPNKFTGYYKYTPGPKYIDKKGNEVKDIVDNGSIYAVFYRNHDAEGNAIVLFGDNVQTSENIIAIAKVPDVHATDEWTKWDIDFVYRGEIDDELLKNKGYSMAIVFSSSFNGDVFEGAVGSTLMIDKVSLICNKED